jgi:predicted ATPase
LGSGYNFEIETDLFQITRMGAYVSLNQLDNLSGNYYTLAVWNDDEDGKLFGKFQDVFSRVFIGKEEYQKINYSDSVKLNLSSSNLEKVLKRLLLDEGKQEEILDWLQLFIPGLEKVEIYADNIGGNDTLLIYEKGSKKPFHKRLISDGTYNILCLLTAVYQSDEPQFLCIEEPENGLTPDVIKEMVTLFRNACEEKGHYIWLNTHSQTLVSQLTADELITVDKVKGETKIKQFKGQDFHGLRMDEVWLTNTLGAGLPW